MIPRVFTSKLAWVIIILYAILFFWWTALNLSSSTNAEQFNLYGAVYPILALIGGFSGLFISRIYGSWGSIMGRGIIFLSLALLGQAVGQLIWAYYNIVLAVEIPYPSIADIGYFAVIPFNILAMFCFAKASGVMFNHRKVSSILISIFIPLILLGAGGYFFLKDYTFDASNPIKVFLDFAYPLGEAFYISLALITYLLSSKLLGGVMKGKILLIIFAFVMQFATDYSYLYAVSQDGYSNGGFVDLMYATSFALYSIVLINLKYITVPEKT